MSAFELNNHPVLLGCLLIGIGAGLGVFLRWAIAEPQIARNFEAYSRRRLRRPMDFTAFRTSQRRMLLLAIPPFVVGPVVAGLVILFAR